VEIGFFFWPFDVALVQAMARAADDFGYDMVGVADTPGNAMDPWVATTLVATATRRARVAMCVTNLVTRHPAVSAAAIASVDLLAPGRAMLGIGVGHSGTRQGSHRSRYVTFFASPTLREERFPGEFVEENTERGEGVKIRDIALVSWAFVSKSSVSRS